MLVNIPLTKAQTTYVLSQRLDNLNKLFFTNLMDYNNDYTLDGYGSNF